MHDVDILRLKADADIRADLIKIGSLDKPLKALEIDYRVVMNALEGDARYRAAKVTVVGRNDIDILGADNDIDWLVFLKACVDTLELIAAAGEAVMLKS